MKKPILVFLAFFAAFLSPTSLFAQTTCPSGYVTASVNNYSASVYDYNSVDNKNYALDQSDETFARLNNSSDYLVLELSQTVYAGDDITIYFASENTQGTVGLVSVSTDGYNYSSAASISTNVKFSNIASAVLTFNQNAKYVKIVYPKYYGTNALMIDAVSGSKVECFKDYNLSTSAFSCVNQTTNICLDSVFNKDDLYGSNTVWSMYSLDNFTANGYSVFRGSTASEEDCCDNGSLTGLTFKYTGVNINDNSQVPMGKASVTTYSSASGDVLVIINGSTSDTNNAYVRKVMSAGDIIELDKVLDGWSNPIAMHVLSVNGTSVYQVATFHTSCSAPVIPGESFGYLQLFSTKIDGAVCGNILTDCSNSLTYFPNYNYTGLDTANYEICIVKNGVEHCEEVNVVFTIDSSNCNSTDCGEGEKEIQLASTSYAQTNLGVDGADKAVGEADGQYATLKDKGDYIILQLIHKLNAGEELTLTATSKENRDKEKLAIGSIAGSVDGLTFGDTIVFSTEANGDADEITFQFDNNIQFIKVSFADASPTELKLDGVSFAGVTCVSDFEMTLEFTTCSTTPLDVCLTDLIPLDSFSTGYESLYLSMESMQASHGYLVPFNQAVSGEDCCDNGSLTGLTFKYTGVNSNNNSQVPMGKASVTTYGSATGSVLVIINGSTSDTNNAYVRKVMSAGDLIAVDKATNGWSNPVAMHILSANGSTEYQVATFHTSCSAPVIPGESYGYLTLYSTTIDGAVCGNSSSNDCEDRLHYFPENNFSGVENIVINVCYDDNGVQICNEVPIKINVKDSICEKLCPLGFVEKEVPNATTAGILSSKAKDVNRAIGEADGSFAKLEYVNDFITLSLDEVLLAGNEFEITIASENNVETVANVYASQDGVTFIPYNQISTSQKKPSVSEVVLSFDFDVQYIKLELDASTKDKMNIDGSRYTGTTCVQGNLITGTVWHDENADTIINAGESGEPQVTVNLYYDDNRNGILESGESKPIQTATTRVGGTYEFSVPFNHTLVTTCKSITTSSDDAEETPKGYLYTNSSDLEFAYESSDWGDQIEGLRFHHLGIPAGAQVQNAYIQFAVDETTGSLGKVTIRGDDVSNSSTFTISNKISARTETTSSVTWSPDYRTWDVVHEQTADQRTPDLSQIIQEIIGNTGWSKDNGITFMFSGTGEVIAESYDGAMGHNNASLAPELCVAYYESEAVDNFIVTIDKTTLPYGSKLTTDNIEVAEFRSTGNIDSLNDFGYVKSGLIAGNVSEDEDGGQASADKPIENVLITLVEDLNKNGVADSGEPTTITYTDQFGNYSFNLLNQGDYIVIETQPTNYRDVEDGDRSDDGDNEDLDYNQDNIIRVTLTLYEQDLNNDFIEELVVVGKITGNVSKDTDGAAPSADEPIGNVTIKLYKDINSNGIAESTEYFGSTTTDGNGNYKFENLWPDYYVVVEIQPANLVSVQDGDISVDGDATDSTLNTDDIINVYLSSGETDSDNNFIESEARDYGDLPLSVMGEAVVNASNTYNKDLFIGALWDSEISSSESINANGDDDYDTSDDEDGFINPTAVIEPDSTSVFYFTVTNNTGSDAYLSFFIDVDKNKVFDNDERKEVTVGSTTSGSQVVSVSMLMPSDALMGEAIYRRVRLSQNPGASASGSQEGGEIEDYLVISALPVELISFNGKLIGDDVELNWSTASEINNDRFEIERRFDGEAEFEKIGEVAGNGNSQEILDYKFLDINNNWPSKVTYYRLKQIDFDGAFEYTQIIAFTKESSFDARVYPNPTRENASITLISDGKLLNTNVRIIDGFGKDVTYYTNLVNVGGAYKINAQALRNGVYTVEITANNKIVTKRLIIAR